MAYRVIPIAARPPCCLRCEHSHATGSAWRCSVDFDYVDDEDLSDLPLCDPWGTCDKFETGAACAIV